MYNANDPVKYDKNLTPEELAEIVNKRRKRQKEKELKRKESLNEKEITDNDEEIIGLVKDLNTFKEENINKLDNKYSDVKQLLSNNEQEKINVINSLGLNHSIVDYQNARSHELDRQIAMKEFGKNIYSKDELLNLCYRYNLQISEIHRYEGKVNNDLISKIIKFGNDYKINVGNNSSQFNDARSLFRIVGSKKAIMNGKNESVILFYKINENVYKLIHMWGKPLSITKLFNGWMYRNWINFTSTIYIFTVITLSFLFSLIFGLLSFGSIILSMIISLLSLLILSIDDYETKSHIYSSNRLTRLYDFNLSDIKKMNSMQYFVIISFFILSLFSAITASKVGAWKHYHNNFTVESHEIEETLPYSKINNPDRNKIYFRKWSIDRTIESGKFPKLIINDTKKDLGVWTKNK